MILDEYVEVTINAYNCKYYENLGYEITKHKNVHGKLVRDIGVSIKVKVSDLQKGSHTVIHIGCDNCGVVKEIPYKTYLHNIEQDGFYYCKDCSYIHREKTNIKKYGNENVFANEKIKEKIKQTNLEKYGFESAVKNHDVLKKMQDTCIKKYGVKNIFELNEVQDKIRKDNLNKYGAECIMKLPEFREKVKQTNLKKYGYESVLQVPEIRIKGMKKMKDANMINVSFQQSYINDVLSEKYNTEINYPCSYYYLDIYLKDFKVDIEIDGGGHDYAVKINAMAKEEFDNKQIARSAQVTRNGIKIIRFIMPTDKLPSDDKILELIDNAINYFNITNHTWINYYIEENKFRNAENQDGSYLDYGDLRDSYKLKKQIEKEAA